MDVMKRDNRIDFFRGIAALAVVLIHTCFWSGFDYTPELMQTLTLAIDVPFFFFLSGWSSTYVDSFERSIRSLLNIYKKYVMFLSFFVVISLLFGLLTNQFTGLTLRNLCGNLFFIEGESYALPVVAGSIWFMPVYFAVIPVGRLIMTKLTFHREGDGYIPLVVTGLGLLYAYWTGSFFHLSAYTLFYLFFFFLGAACKEICVRKFKTVILFCLADLGVMKLIGIYFGWDISNMQSMKFPPSIIYLLYSLLWITATLWLKGKIKDISSNHVLCRIGRAAILFYFCQVISSSLLFYLVPRIDLAWGVKLPIAFLLNLTGTMVLVILLKRFYGIEEYLAAWLKKMVKRIDGAGPDRTG